MNNAMNACVFANGGLDFSSCVGHDSIDHDSINSISCDFNIAADGGVRHCLNLGIKPDLIVGDMDSIDAASAAATKDIEKIVFDREKNKTDTACAIDEAFNRRYSQVTILGGVDGRIDHTIGNLALAAKYPGKVALATPHGLLIGLGPFHECKLTGPIGAIVSIVVWGENAKLRSKGLKYPLDSEIIETGSRGISNEISETPSSLYVITGTILLFIEKSIRFSLPSSIESHFHIAR